MNESEPMTEQESYYAARSEYVESLRDHSTDLKIEKLWQLKRIADALEGGIVTLNTDL
jgi:hypothetical protein